LPEDLFALKGRVLVVLGGATGIGQAIALAYARAGAQVVVSSRRQQAVEDTAGRLRELGSETLALTSDVQDSGSLERLRGAVMEKFGKIDGLVVSSGINVKAPSLEMPEADYLSIIDTNLNGVFRACQIFGRQMAAQRSGAIVNIASIAGIRGVLEMAAYNASKAGVISLTESLGREWAPLGVRVNGIAPGPFRTELSSKILAIPGRYEHLMRHMAIQRLGELDELTGAAIYLASDASSFVTGQTLVVDGGLLLNNI